MSKPVQLLVFLQKIVALMDDGVIISAISVESLERQIKEYNKNR